MESNIRMCVFNVENIYTKDFKETSEKLIEALGKGYTILRVDYVRNVIIYILEKK